MKILIFFFLLISSFKVYAFNGYEPEIPDKINIFITKSIYFQLLRNILDDSSKIIHSSYKIPFDGVINYKKNNKTKSVNATISINGEYKDHIRENYSSLKIRLKNDNIGNIINFRLLLPHTRKGNNAILWSILLEELDYLVPYKKIINVTINGNHYKAIFEEEIDSTFLERSFLGESPIIEVDERQIFGNRYWSGNKEMCLNKNDCPGTVDPLFDSIIIKNKKFLKNQISSYIFLKSMNQVFLRSQLEKFFSADKIFKKIIIKENSIIKNYKNNLLYYELNNNFAQHGLNFHNQKWLYDPIYSTLLPIYNDGDVSFKSLCSENKKGIISHINLSILIKHLYPWIPGQEGDFIEGELLNPNENNIDEYLYKLSQIKEKFEERTNSIFSENHLCNMLYIFFRYDINFKRKEIKNYPNLIDKIKKFNFLKYEPLVYKKIDKSHIKFIGIDDDKSIKECYFENTKSLNKVCKTLNLKKQIKYFSGKGKPLKVFNYDVFPIIVGKLNDKKINIFSQNKIINLRKDIKNILIPTNNTIFLQLTPEHEELNVTLDDPYNSRLVIYDSKLGNNFKLNISSKIKPNNDSHYYPYNTRLLTGCVTIIDTIVENSSFIMKGGGCEDSINFKRVNGSINNITIDNAYQDALDLDYSNLNIQNIDIKNSSNDCIDLSKGDYNLNLLVLENCGDKAVSAGEQTFLTINKIIINSANIGIASKDSSIVYLNEFKEKDTNLCLSAYRKKQEFEGGIIKIKYKIKCKSFYDRFSYIKNNNNEVCQYVRRSSNFFLCKIENNIFLNFKKKNIEEKNLLLEITTQDSLKSYDLNNIDSIISCKDQNFCTLNFKTKELLNGILIYKVIDGSKIKIADLYNL